MTEKTTLQKVLSFPNRVRELEEAQDEMAELIEVVSKGIAEMHRELSALRKRVHTLELVTGGHFGERREINT